ncbi:MAG TPA: HEAT repeat domain-containing protein [Nitrospiraceae bacterium]
MKAHHSSHLVVTAVLIASGVGWGNDEALSFVDGRSGSTWLIQAPDAGEVPYGYGVPPGHQEVPDTSIPPSNKPLGPEELQRAEALLPLLEGKQEFWAMGEFVHLGGPAVPVVTKALSMPSPRIRYNAIETLQMIKDPSAVPALIRVAQDLNEMPRIREHALRVAVRLNASAAAPAIEIMAKDQESAVRKVAAFEARYVRQKAVVPVLIGMMADEERFVATTAIHSLWILTRHESEMHDWDTSTKQDREAWAKEWVEWWSTDRDTFQFPDPKKPRDPLQ